MTRPALSLRSKLLFATIATLVGALFLVGGLEGALRVAGYGCSPHFVRRDRDANGHDVWRENRSCTAPFFGPALVRRPQPFAVPVVKPPRSYRIVVLGSSAAMGDPEASFSLARMLQIALRQAYPEIRFEVINAGITAINSHLMRSIAEDCVALQPDLFIVYEGNNEVIGPYGPAGILAPFLQTEPAVRGSQWVRGTRIGQLVAAAGRGISGTRANDDWGGMQMFVRQEIAADDPRLDAVRTNFAANLRAVGRTARQSGAALLLCTVLTNQRDFPPFLSRHRGNLTTAEQKSWEEHFARAVAAELRADWTAAAGEFAAAAQIDDRHAELAFRRGRVALQRGRDVEARTWLQDAVDLDTLRFRTDSSLNAVIRSVGADTPGVTLVDIAGALAAASAHGIPGDDLLYEHVHLTLRGTYEVAARLLPVIAANLQQRGLAGPNPPPMVSMDEARQRLAYTTYEQAMIGLELLRRFRAPPFEGQSDNGMRIAAWERRLATAHALLSRTDATPAFRAIYDEAMAQAPDDWVLARNAGAMLVARGQPADALPLLERARKGIPDDPDTLVALALAHQALGQTSQADALFSEVRRLEPRHPLLPK